MYLSEVVDTIHEMLEKTQDDYSAMVGLAKRYEQLLIKCAQQSTIARRLIKEEFPELIPDKVFDGDLINEPVQSGSS